MNVSILCRLSRIHVIHKAYTEISHLTSLRHLCTIYCTAFLQHIQTDPCEWGQRLRLKMYSFSSHDNLAHEKKQYASSRSGLWTKCPPPGWRHATCMKRHARSTRLMLVLMFVITLDYVSVHFRISFAVAMKSFWSVLEHINCDSNRTSWSSSSSNSGLATALAMILYS